MTTRTTQNRGAPRSPSQPSESGPARRQHEAVDEWIKEGRAPVVSRLQSVRGGQYFVVGATALALGCLWVAFDSMAWFYAQWNISVHTPGSIFSLVVSYYQTEALAVGLAATGTLLLFWSMKRMKSEADPMSVRSIVADALSSRRSLRVGVAAAAVYAVAYALVSSILVYQPQVDFASAYAVTGPSVNVAACCGSPGTVPAMIVYLAPWTHVGIQILPLDLLFVVLFPLLVGLNVTVSAFAYRSGAGRGSSRLMGPIGVLAGLFTGCPTCAGFFLASAVGGLGASTLAIALAPFQAFFVILSIPLLLVSPLLIAKSFRRSMLASCPVPGAARGAEVVTRRDGSAGPSTAPRA